MTDASNADELQLPLCPSSPNCVSSQASDQHHIAPFRFKGTSEQTWNALIELLKSSKRVAIISHTDSQLHATQTSLIFRFVDDLEFVLDAKQQRIDVRSASRVGYYDFGVNRRRVEHLRQQLHAQGVLDNAP